MKKFLLVLSAILLSQVAIWAYDFEAGNIQYTVTSLEDLTVEVSGLVSSDVTKVTIPETTEYKSRELTVTSIGASAFRDNKKLKTISLPSTITRIYNQAFQNCTSLTQIDLPEGLLSLGSYAFSGSGLTSLSFPNLIASVPTYCFYGCKSLTEVNLPSSLNTINQYAFYNCSSLKKLDIPDNVTSLGNYAFRGCSKIESLYVGTGLEYLIDVATSTQKSNPNYATDYYYEYYPLLWEDGPSKIENIILRDDKSEFSVRGYGYCWSTYNANRGYPSFSNINVGYYYVGRPLTDIKSWTHSNRTYNVSLSRPHGTIQTLEIGGYCTDVPYFYQSVEDLILGKDVKTFTASNICQDEMKSITCKTMTPPTVSGTFDTSTYVTAILYVPTGSKETYQAAEGWKDFWDIQEMDVDDMASAEKVFNEDNAPMVSVSKGTIIVSGTNNATVNVYNMQGQLVYSGHNTVIPVANQGIYIVNVNGSAKKVLIK